jgi:hypothetical protein
MLQSLHACFLLFSESFAGYERLCVRGETHLQLKTILIFEFNKPSSDVAQSPRRMCRLANKHIILPIAPTEANS